MYFVERLWVFKVYMSTNLKLGKLVFFIKEFSLHLTPYIQGGKQIFFRKVSEPLKGGFVVISVVNNTSITGASVARLLIQSYSFMSMSP